jgi:hypothetical protein
MHAIMTTRAQSSTDTYVWANPLGGSWSVAGNWTDASVGAVAQAAPGAGSLVVVGTGASEADLVLSAPLTITRLTVTASGGDAPMVLWGGGLTVAGLFSMNAADGYSAAVMELDAWSSLSVVAAQMTGKLQVGGGSHFSVKAGTVLGANTLIEALDGGTIQTSIVVSNDYTGYGQTIAVDAASSFEVGTTGHAASGALTIDGGNVMAIAGSVLGNVVVNGTLTVAGGQSLTISGYGGSGFTGSAASITGTGTIALMQDSSLTLNAASATPTIQFSGQYATLYVGGVGTGLTGSAVLSGFDATDSIVADATITGVGYTQTTSQYGTLTLRSGGATVATYTLRGNYSNAAFHVSVTPAYVPGIGSINQAVVTMRTIGQAPVTPKLISGSGGADTLRAAGNGQTLTGSGGNDLLSGYARTTVAGGVYTDLTFKDKATGLDGDSIQGFSTTDRIDLIDMLPASARLSWQPSAGGFSTLTATDGTHTAHIGVSFPGVIPAGGFVASADGAGGTQILWSPTGH